MKLILQVPEADRHIAIRRGVRWDGKRKAWSVETDDPERFRRWIPQKPTLFQKQAVK